MKKIAGWLTIAAVFMIMMTWSFTPRVSAGKTEPENDSVGADLQAQATRKRELSKRFTDHLLSPSPGKGISFWPDALFSTQSASQPTSRRQLNEEARELAGGAANDPDLSPDIGGVVDKEAYLKARGDQIAMMRGMDPDKPFDVTKRIQAIKQMETQEAQVAKEVKAGIRPEAIGTFVSIGPNFLPNGQTEDYPTTMSPVSGRLTAIDIHPTNANIAYVGTAQGGVWRTTDGGVTWTPILDSAQTLAIGAVTIDPVTPTTVFIGTGEGNNNSDGYPGVGVYIIRSADTSPVITGPFRTRIDGSGTVAGTATDAFLNSAITRIAVDPNNDNRIFVGNNIAFSGNPGVQVPNITTTGLYFSDNAQSATPTFSKVGPVAAGSYLTASNQAPVTDIVFEPGSSNNLLFFVDDRFGLGNGGVYRTTNATAAPAAAPTITKTLTIPVNINGRLAIQKTGTTVTVYEASGESATQPQPASPVFCADVNGVVRKSVDGGATWGTPLPDADGFCWQQCFYDIALDVDPTNANNVHLGGWANASGCDHVYEKSTDGGTTFNATESGLHADTHAVRVAPSSPTTVWFGSDGGIFKSIDQGSNWVSQNPNGISALQFQSVAVHPTSRNYTIGGTQDNGTPRRDDVGNWTRADLGDGGYALIDQASTDTVANMRIYHTRFADTAHLTYQRATNGAQANDLMWENRGCGYTGYLNNGFGTTPGVSAGQCPTGAVGEPGCTCKPTTSIMFYPPMALGPLSPNSVYYGSDRLWRSTDNGVTMTQVSQGPITSGIAITTISVESTTGLLAPRNDNVRLVGLRNGTVFGTITGSATLVTANFTPPTRTPASTTNRAVGRVAIDPTNPNVAYLTLAYYQSAFNAATSPQVWKTTNLNVLGTGTVVWSPAGNGIPNIPVNAFAIDAGNPNNVFAGTDIGVYNSTDGGTTWVPFGTGLPVVAVFDMAISRAQSSVLQPPVLRVATHGRGMYEAPISAPTAAGTDIRGQVLTSDGRALGGVVVTTVGGSKVYRTLTDSQGNYSFADLAANEFYTVMPALANYSFSPVTRSFSLSATVTDATFTASPDAIAVDNPLNSDMFFVRQQYLDFLGREPDGGGLGYWTNELEKCGTDVGCINNRRVAVAAAFFIEQEYQQTGSFVYRLYKGALGRQLSFSEFSADRGHVVAGAGLDQSKDSFAGQFVQREEFMQKYQGKNNAESFVDALVSNVRQANGVDLASQRDALIAKYNSGGDLNQSRSLALKEAIENSAFKQAEYNPSFVLMEYFGYLKRDPEAAGYEFWLNVLNNKEPGNYRGMVCSFITSAEYQGRFSPVTTHNNQECR